VKVPAAAACDDLIADGEGSPAAGGDLVGRDVAVGLEQPTGETVELAATVVASLHERMGCSVLAGLPPAGEEARVELEVVGGEVEVTGRFKFGEGAFHLAVAQRFDGGEVALVFGAGGSR
jgi:hypothetical protein